MGEQNDLSKIEGRKAKELTAKLHQWRKDVDAQMMPPNPDYDIALDPWSGKETSKGSRIVNALGYMNTSTQKLIVTCMALLCLSSPARSGETLYNGIVLHDGFPLPAKEGGRKIQQPMPVLYLDNPPKIIPVDVGRQLFVDDFLTQGDRRTTHCQRCGCECGGQTWQNTARLGRWQKSCRNRQSTPQTRRQDG